MEMARYTRMVLGGLGLLLLVALVLSFTWVRQPQTGDLGRIGGYTEAGFGARLATTWLGFERPEFERVGTGNPAEADVLVLGDSFSNTGGRFNWVSQLAVRSGLSVLVGNLYRWPDILDPESAVALPPLVLLEVAERDAVDLLAMADYRLGSNIPDSRVAEPWQAPRLRSPRTLPPSVPLPRKRFADIEERFSVTLDVAWKSLRRALGMPRDEVVVIGRDPARPAVFSSSNQDAVALIRADLEAVRPSRDRYASALEGLGKLRRLVESRGSRLALLVIPNRFSVYREVMLNAPFADTVPVVNRLAADDGLYNALPMMHAAVERGELDLFWPMDSHLSPVGAALLADDFLRWLIEAGLLQD